jgi:hypothetical protein
VRVVLDAHREALLLLLTEGNHTLAAKPIERWFQTMLPVQTIAFTAIEPSQVRGILGKARQRDCQRADTIRVGEDLTGSVRAAAQHLTDEGSEA